MIGPKRRSLCGKSKDKTYAHGDFLISPARVQSRLKILFLSMLSKKTKYALHALSYLAKYKSQGAVLIQSIAEEFNISHKFLENILLELKKAGLLGSKKGKGGGYYLIKEPAEISLARIIRLVDGPIALVSCASLHYYERCTECKDEVSCGMNKVMIQVRNQTLKVLETKSIQDIIDQDEMI
jgi:Rrf2 family protein